MPISIGLHCETCGTIHFINRMLDPNLIGRLSRSDVFFTMECRSCGKMLCFNKQDLKPYSVPSVNVAAGYAKRGQYNVACSRRTGTSEN
jgi:hypothetical protein